MIILSIETSADDTSISIVNFREGGGEVFCTILGHMVSSQTDLHTGYGGIFPALAKREHIKNLPIVYEQVTAQAGNPQIDLIAVTHGPGLEPCLWTGITFAQELAEKLNVPIIPVNHMEGHLLSGILPEFIIGKEVKLHKVMPDSIALLVSGGHTEIVKVSEIGKYEVIGHTLDDAIGEAFDKVARMLDLPYPGGPEISRLAETLRVRNSASGSLTQADGPSRANFQQEIMSADGSTISHEPILPSFPRPMIHSKDYNFSFSGLKTAVLYYIRDLQKEHSDILQNVGIKEMIAKEFEDAAIDVVTSKIFNAVDEYGASELLLGGGVSANKYLREQLLQKGQKRGLAIREPVRELTGDNALMIAIAGYYNRNKKIPANISANGNLCL